MDTVNGRVACPRRVGQALNFRVADPSRFFEVSEGLIYFSSEDLDSLCPKHVTYFPFQFGSRSALRPFRVLSRNQAE
jgi:hypothetical protein